MNPEFGKRLSLPTGAVIPIDALAVDVAGYSRDLPPRAARVVPRPLRGIEEIGGGRDTSGREREERLQQLFPLDVDHAADVRRKAA